MNEEMVDMTNREILLALMGRMGGVENVLSDFGSKFDTLEAGQKELYGKFDALEAGQKELHDKVDALEAGQKELHGKVDALETLHDKFDILEAGQKELYGKFDILEAGQKELYGKFDTLETGQKKLHGRIDTLEDNINMEIQAVRTEMDMVYKSLKQDVGFLNDKVDRILILKDVDGVEKIKIRLDVLEQGYQSLKVKMG